MHTDTAPARFLSTRRAWTILLLVWFAVYFAALFSPALLDDADAAHANAAQHMALSGDWVTLKINGIRYLEKAPLPYWLTAIDDHIFGYNVFSAHLPMALGVLATAMLAWHWTRRAFNERAAFYAALALLTGVGVFLFTRIDIPEALLTFFIGLALYCFLLGLEDRKPLLFYVSWASLADRDAGQGPHRSGLLFRSGSAVAGRYRGMAALARDAHCDRLAAVSGNCRAVAHSRRPAQSGSGQSCRQPSHLRPCAWLLLLLFHQRACAALPGQALPGGLQQAAGMDLLDRPNRLVAAVEFVSAAGGAARVAHPHAVDQQSAIGGRCASGFAAARIWLLSLYAGFMLVFFSISTNQEYYTFPAYLPLLMLTAAVLASFELRAERIDEEAREGTDGWLIGAHVLFAIVGVLSAAALSYGLWTSRHLAFVPDIGTLLAHRGVGDYSLSMSHLFDLTGPSFAALRLPAVIAAVVLLVGPVLALQLRRRARHFEATLSVAFTIAIFLIAAHIAFVRFAPMLSSEPMAATINRVAGYPASESPSDPAATRATLIVYGDQSDGASVLFYTRRQALLVHGRSSTMVWGSMWPDAPHVFIDDKELASIWGTGNRKFLFAQAERRDQVEAVLGKRLIPIQELADKTLYTDRPL